MSQAHVENEASAPTQAPVFADVVEAADALSEEEQAELIGILRRRRTARGRERLVRECREAEADYQAGRIKPATVEEIMREIDS